MKSNNPQIERLKQMMALEERRSLLQNELDGLLQKMAGLKNELFGESGAAPRRTPASTPPAATPAPAPSRRRRRGRGALKETIMAALSAAGSAGVHVKELAAAIGTKPVNVHSWFHSTSKRNAAIKKISGGHYRLDSTGAPSTSSAGAAPKGRKTKGVKAARPSGKRKAAAGGTKRGALSSQIIAELGKAGSAGTNVRALADKLGANYKNIYIWFSTTGKKNASIQKLGPATYKLASA